MVFHSRGRLALATILLMAANSSVAATRVEGNQGGGYAPSAGSSSGTSSTTTSTTEGARQPSVDQALLTTLYDTDVVNYISHLSQAEIQLAVSAGPKLQSAGARAINQRIWQDHQNSLALAQKAAGALGVPLAAFQLGSHEIAQANSLDRLQGNVYDQAYLKTLQEGHQDAIQKLERMRSESLSPQTQQLISSVLPGLQKHLDLVTSELSGKGDATPGASSGKGK